MFLNAGWLLAVPDVGHARNQPGGLERLRASLHHSPTPDAAIYDAFVSPFLGCFFTRVARDLLAIASRGAVLEVGSGPGRLAVRLAELAPELRVTAFDLSGDMLERANARAARRRVADRVTFCLGDVSSLPFRDQSFEAVVSTFSLHHWPDPARGLAEVERVLRPGGTARIYDLAGWAQRGFRHGGPGLALLLASIRPGADGAPTVTTAMKLGPVPIAERSELRRGEPHS